MAKINVFLYQKTYNEWKVKSIVLKRTDLIEPYVYDVETLSDLAQNSRLKCFCAQEDINHFD